MRELDVRVPDALASFWRVLGSGYFGRRELYWFGDAGGDRESLIEWNKKDFWRGVNPPPRGGGALFFAETCFGEQLGFRWIDARCEAVLFIVDTFETFIVCRRFDDLFERVLVDRGAVDDPELTDALIAQLDVVPRGSHYAPIVSPLLGGSRQLGNFHVETANIHFRTAIATWKAAQQLRSGTRIAGIDVELKK